MKINSRHKINKPKLDRLHLIIIIPKGRLFVVNGQDIYFRQEVVVTLWCPMRFDFYPLDKQVVIAINK